MVRASAVLIIVVIVALFTTVGNAQPIGSNQVEKGSEAVSWEMYRQRQIEMQLELQQQQLEIQRQQYQWELEKQRIEQQKKQMEQEER